MPREATKKLSLRQKLILLVVVGVLLPLSILTYLQYRSLSELRNKTKGALKDNIRQGMTLVEQRMKHRFQKVAAQTFEPFRLNLASLETAEEAELERYFADFKRKNSHVRQVFLITYPGLQQKGNARGYFYYDKLLIVEQREFSQSENRILFLNDKSLMAQAFLDDAKKYWLAQYSCLTCPISGDNGQGTFLFHQLTEGDRYGVVGVLLVQEFVTDQLIGRSINEVLNAYHSGGSPEVAIVVRDENFQTLYTNGTAKGGSILESNFQTPFSSWKAVVGLKNSNIDELARDSFLHSAGATALVLLCLLGGIALTLRATDREARLAQAKSTFVANVSHELKTPLSLISLFSEILELGRVNSEEKKAEYYGIIRHESLRLNKTIDNILDFSRIEAGRKKYDLVEGDIGEVIENVLSTHRYQFTNSGFDVQTNIEPGLPTVLIDREAMSQAISNLIDNAIKYSGKVKQLSISAKKVDSSVSIEFVDQGVGIPRAEQAKVFEKFYRVGNGLVHDVKGSGLGLSLVKHIVEAHHGMISLESDLGKGSRFTISLPIAHKGTVAERDVSTTKR